MHTILTTGRVPSLSTLSPQQQHQLVETWAYTLSMGLLVMLLMVGRSRKLLVETSESIAVLILIVLLLGIVAAMPVATIYISYRGSAFVLEQVLAHFGH